MILGIDPGRSGAFAFREKDGITLEIMPTNEHGIDWDEVFNILSHYRYHITRCYLEQASIRPGQASQATTIRNGAVLEGILISLKIPYSMIRPSDWSVMYDHGVKEKNKEKRKRLIKIARRSIAANLYPDIDLRKSSRSKIADEGIVDAILIADYGFNKHTSSKGSTHHG